MLCVVCVEVSKKQLSLTGVSGTGGSDSSGQGAPATSTGTQARPEALGDHAHLKWGGSGSLDCSHTCT